MDSARDWSNGRETGVARQPQWVEKAAVRSPRKTILVLARPLPDHPIGKRLQPLRGMEPLRLTCGAASDPVGRHSYVAPCLFVWGRTWISFLTQLVILVVVVSTVVYTGGGKYEF